MKPFSRLLFVVATTLILSGCATAPGQKFSGFASPQKDKSDVYLYRTGAIFAVLQSFEVTVDGNKAGDLYNASYLRLQLAPGKHSLRVYPGGISVSSELEINAEPGKLAFYQYSCTPGPMGLLTNGLFLGATIDPRSQEQAVLDLKNLKLAN